MQDKKNYYLSLAFMHAVVLDRYVFIIEDKLGSLSSLMFRSNFETLQIFYTAVATNEKHTSFNRQLNFLRYRKMPRKTYTEQM
jgi:hypothetical protein